MRKSLGSEREAQLNFESPKKGNLVARLRDTATGPVAQSPLRKPQSSASLTKLLRPIVEFLQTFFAHTGPDVYQTGLEVFESNGSDLIRRHVQ